MRTVNDIIRANAVTSAQPIETVVLPHDERHLRRKRITLASGDAVMVDFPEAIHLHHGDRLRTEDGAEIEVIAAPEILTEIRAQNPAHHAQLCWHIGNRHLKAQIEPERILILQDKVIDTMLEGLDATISHVEEPFHPMHGAYHKHDHG